MSEVPLQDHHTAQGIKRPWGPKGGGLLMSEVSLKAGSLHGTPRVLGYNSMPGDTTPCRMTGVTLRIPRRLEHKNPNLLERSMAFPPGALYRSTSVKRKCPPSPRNAYSLRSDIMN